MIANPSQNFGWIIIGDETASSTLVVRVPAASAVHTP
jgi:hypothetical protein